FTADGGIGGYRAGGGGGGRVAVYYFESIFSGVPNSTVSGGSGGSGGYPGETGTIIFFGPKERFLVSDNSIYIDGNQNHFKMRNGVDAPVGLRVQCLASGSGEANKYAVPSTNKWKTIVPQGAKVFGYFMPNDCYEDNVRETKMGDDDAGTKADDANSPGFVSAIISFTDTNRVGWLRAFSSVIITNAAYYGDTVAIDSVLDWPGKMNVAWIPANPIISNINPAFVIPFDVVPTSAFERLEGSVDSSVSGGNNQLQSEWILVEYRLEGSTTWLPLDNSINSNGDFSGTISSPDYPVDAYVRARMKDNYTPRTGLPLSDEKIVTNVGPLLIEMTTIGPFLTNAWPVRVSGTSLSANTIVLSNTTDGSTHLCSGTDNWACDLTGNDNTYESYVAVAIAGAEIAVSSNSVSIDQDNIPPAVTMISPANNFTSRSTTITFTFTAMDIGHNVAYTEISTNNGVTWFNFTSGNSLTFADHQLCSWRARATDDVPLGNTSAGTNQFNFLVYALLVNMNNYAPILTNSWPVRISGTSLNAKSIILSNITDGSTTLCTGIDNWYVNLTGNDNTYESYAAVAIDGTVIDVSTNFVAIDHDNIPPTVTMISPQNNSTNRSTSVTFIFNAVDDRHSIAHTEISTNNGAAWFNFTSGNSLTFDDHQQYSWRARATDNVPLGNTSDGSNQFNFLVFNEVKLDVMCVWPQYIGAGQSGVVEFISDFGANYRIYAVDSSTQDLAVGVCNDGWNLIHFFGRDLPDQTFNNPNHLFVEVGTQLFDGGFVYVVEDLSTDKKDPTIDIDGDEISVSYKGSGSVSSKGRTLFIKNGSPKDKIMVKVKAAKGVGDGVCRICGIITDSGFSSIKITGDLDKLEAGGEGKTVILKGGNLGQKCATERFFVIFDGPKEKAKGKIIVKASKNKSTKSFIGGNIYANILCGTLQNEPNTVASLGSLKIIADIGGDIGFPDGNKRLLAYSLGKLSTKAAKNVGGGIIDYSAYFTGEEKSGKGMSAKSILANDIIDSTGSNVFFVFGYNELTNPLNVTNWLIEPVIHSFGKITVKGTALDGTFVIKEWLKGDKSKHVKSKAIDNAVWIVNGVKE
ncbi:MAG: hypothetical protein DRI44_01935, partial [Chlamydiae bacterium]